MTSSNRKKILPEEKKLEDGLYRVKYKQICAAFVVKNGEIIRMAPVLRKRINWWKTIAKKVG